MAKGDEAMNVAFGPVSKQSLSERLARQIRVLIQQGDFQPGDRLPAIMEMARRFRVGHPTVREALKTLETIGVVEIRHGSGVYVNRSEDVLVLASPHHATTFTKKLLLDLLRTRQPLEIAAIVAAVEHGAASQLQEMRQLLATAGQNLTDDDELNRVNMAFHREISLASGNTVLLQTLDVLRELFTDEQRLILGIIPSREGDHQEHLEILAALERRDATLAAQLMQAHVENTLAAVMQWDPELHPVG
jgi:GntR family transcriptional regulator, transcriptional repressor for pyruvate dehydrogenase complex